MSKIGLTTAIRSNLLSLQKISGQVSSTQNILSTGKKVNSAIDNPSSYYTAQSLSNRASDLSAMLDSMGQAVQTIKAATEGLDAAGNMLEQMLSVTEQALTALGISAENGGGTGGVARMSSQSVVNFEAEGYQVISSGMSADEIEALLTAGAKVYLSEDIVLDRGLKITAANVVLNGNGHKLTYTASTAKEAVVAVDGSGASAEIANLKIEASGEQVYGIAARNGGKITLDNAQGIKVSGTGAQKLWFRDEALYNGKGNTQAMLHEIGADALAATAANQFYVGDKNGTFGQGKWYLPAIGELMDMYGMDMSSMTDAFGDSGAIGDNMNAINAALSKLKAAGIEAETLADFNYWSSSEEDNHISWVINLSTGNRTTSVKKSYYGIVRCFQLIENCFKPSGNADAPKIGDVMYDDKTWGSADDYAAAAARKTAVGVVTEVREDGSVKIMNLKDLTFSSTGNFDPDLPFAESLTQLTTSAKWRTDVAGIPNYDFAALLSAMKSGGSINVTFTGSAGGGTGASAYTAQYNELLNQYDMLINDSGYKGVNLLKNDMLDVRFNEDGSSRAKVAGKDVSTQAIGLTQADWSAKEGLQQSIDELKQAIATLRSFATELGNSYSIVTTRQNFTENLINVLEEGADKLTLADMNEESANMLALQTRQQLAINSLSLASQANQSILKLF